MGGNELLFAYPGGSLIVSLKFADKWSQGEWRITSFNKFIAEEIVLAKARYRLREKRRKIEEEQFTPSQL